MIKKAYYGLLLMDIIINVDIDRKRAFNGFWWCLVCLIGWSSNLAMRFHVSLLWKLMSETDKLKTVALWELFGKIPSWTYADSVKIAVSPRSDDVSPASSNLKFAQSGKSCDHQLCLTHEILAKLLMTDISYLSPFALESIDTGGPVSVPVQTEKWKEGRKDGEE